MPDSKERAPRYDYVLLVPTLLLLGLGLVATFSASSFLAAHKFGDSYFFLKKQASFCLIGLGLMVVAKNIPCTFYSRLVYPLLMVTFCLLILLLIPGVGITVGGASRWMGLAGMTFQPSELVKLTLAIYMAYSMAKKGPHMSIFSKGFLPHLMVSGAFMALILLQPDLGTTVIIGCWLLILLFVGGARLLHLITIALMFLPVVYWLISQADYRLKRWWAFLNPWEDPQGLGFQIIHSFLAFGSGGIFGL